MSCASTTVSLVLSLAALGAAAKAHGRQIRLERERAGYTRVVFGGDNPAFVVALWRRDRVRLWSVAAAVALAATALHLAHLGPLRGGLGTAQALLLAPMLAGFVVSGLASWAALLRTSAVDPSFTRRSLPGSAAWWTLVLALAAATVCSADCS